MIRQPKTERDVRAASKTLDHAFVHQLQHESVIQRLAPIAA